jgi:nicotinamidase/pyrazinamidase
MNKALVIIDVQKDFCEGGILPASDTFSLIEPLNDTINWCVNNKILCVFTRDWHPVNHASFIEFGGTWKPHCVQGSEGAEFAEGLFIPGHSLIIDIETDSNKLNTTYSAFENTNLESELHRLRITEIAAAGIATDYCIRATVLDALNYGIKCTVLTDLIRAIDIMEIDSIEALGEMESEGAILMTSQEWMEI